MEEIYLAGGCLWGVQEFLRYLPGVISTEAGRANGKTSTLSGEYDGYVECVKTTFDPLKTDVKELLNYLFEIIDPYSINKQGDDIGPKYRTGLYSRSEEHLRVAKEFVNSRDDRDRVALEILPLTNYVKSAQEHQDRLLRYPNDYCHIPKELLYKYRIKND